MKKLLLVSGTVLILTVAVYTTITSYSQTSNTYNNKEYYYNDDAASKEDGDDMASENQTAVITEKADTIDTIPDSITALVNKEYSLPSDYVPVDLMEPDVLFSINYHDDKRMLRAVAAHALEDLFSAAEKEGLIFYGVSGYRSYARQEEIYNGNLISKGPVHTNLYSAKPGFSEHQTGLAIDVSTISVNNRLDEGFAATPESKWLEDNAHKFGFIIRYPEDKSNITGYSYEPWHIRYVGLPLAAYIYDNDLTLEEYYNYTPSTALTDDDSYGTVVDIDNEDLEETPGTPAPSAAPTPVPSPSVPEESSTPVPSVKEPVQTKKPSPTKNPVTPAPKTPTPATPVPEITPMPSAEPSVTPAPEATPSMSPSPIPESPETPEEIQQDN